MCYCLTLHFNSLFFAHAGSILALGDCAHYHLLGNQNFSEVNSRSVSFCDSTLETLTCKSTYLASHIFPLPIYACVLHCSVMDQGSFFGTSTTTTAPLWGEWICISNDRVQTAQREGFNPMDTPSLRMLTRWSLAPSLKGAGLPYEKVGDARQKLLFWPPRRTKKGVVHTFRVPGPNRYQRWQHTESETHVLSQRPCFVADVHFTDTPAPKRYRVNSRILLSDF